MTGVQTCALPIYLEARLREARLRVEEGNALPSEAESIEVSGTWNYRLYEDSRHIRLPPTPENTL